MKYKLIKQYPDSHVELGHVLDFKDTDSIEIYDGCWDYCFTLSEIKQYPEFWEIVEEKQYEVLEVTHTDDSKLYLSSNGKYDIVPNSKFGIVSLKIALYGSNITSIKRVSDGEVFSVGDILEQDGEPKSIISIELDDKYLGGVRLGFSSNEGVCLEMAVKFTNQALFSTEDGYPVYEGDIFYSVTSGSGHLSWKPVDYVAMQGMQPVGVTFYDKENATIYILENKPVLSYREVVDFLVGNMICSLDVASMLEDIVDSKFNG